MKSILVILLVAAAAYLVSARCGPGEYCRVNEKGEKHILRIVNHFLGPDPTGRTIVEAFKQQQVVAGKNYVVLTKGDEKHEDYGSTVNQYCIVLMFKDLHHIVHLKEKRCETGNWKIREKLLDDLHDLIQPPSSCGPGEYCSVDAKGRRRIRRLAYMLLGRDPTGRKILSAWEQVVAGTNYAVLTKGDERVDDGSIVNLYCLLVIFQDLRGAVQLKSKKCEVGGWKIREMLWNDLHELIDQRQHHDQVSSKLL